MVSIGGSTPRRRMSGAPLDWRSKDGEGIASWWNGIAGGVSDLGRGVGNAASDLGDFFAGRAPTTKAGSQVFGPDTGQSGVDRGEVIRARNRVAADRQRMAEQQAMQEQANQPSPTSFIEYLKQALGLLGDGSGGGIPSVNYDPQREALRRNTAEGDANVANMYLALQRQFADAVPVVQANTDQTKAALNQTADSAQQNVAQSNSAIRTEQSRQLADLGIEDALTNLITSGNNQARDQALASSGIEASRANQLGTVDTTGQAAEEFTRSLGNTAGLEGGEKRAALQRNLIQGLAEIDAQEQQQNAGIAAQNASSRGGSFTQAMNLAQILSGEDPNSYASQAQSAQQQWENDMAAAEFNAKYGQQQGANPQALIDFIAQMQKGTGQTYNTDQYLKALEIARKIFGQ